MHRTGWLVAGALLLLLAAWLLGRDEAPNPHEARARRLAELEFPRYPRPEEMERISRRLTLPPRAGDAGAAADEPHRDPLMVAMAGQAEAAVVLEATTLRHMPIAELLLGCLSADERAGLDRVRGELGIDLLEGLDRVAFFKPEAGDELLLVDGGFEAEKLHEALTRRGAEAREHGEKGMLYTPRPVALRGADAGYDLPFVAMAWGDQMLAIGDDPEALSLLVDRIEGRAPADEPALQPGQAYGEIYGTIGASLIAELLPEGLAEAARVAERIELHVDATDDVLIVADVDGPVSGEMADLAKTVGAALTVARFGARAEGNHELLDLLDLARVMPAEGSFRVETALPLAVLRRHLEGCGGRERSRARRALDAP